MGTWEDELDLDLSDIWAAGTSKPVVQVEEEKDDDLAFPSQENRETPRVLGLEAENGNVTRLQTPLLLDADIADAPTQVASQPFVSRGSGSTVPLATQPLPSRGLPPLPTFQPVEHVLQSEIQLPTPNLASREHGQRGSRNPNLREKAPVDIRNYFTHRGSSSGEGASARKKPRIPGPVGDLFRKEQDVVDGDGDGDGDAAFGEDDFNDRIFRKGAWICALQSLNVAEFDPARYAILKVTASSIASSRTQQVPHFVAVIKELTPNVFGDAAVILKDPTGTVAGMMNNKVFSNTDYAKAISPGAVIVLKQVALFSPSVHYLNITISNVVQVFPANTDLPSGSAPKQQQQRQQEPLPQQPQPQPQRQPQPSPPQLQPQPQRPSPTQLQPQPQRPSPTQPQPQQQPQPRQQPQPSPPQLQPQPQLQRQPQPSPPQLRPQSPSQPLPSPPQEQQGLQPPEAQSQPRPASPPQAAAKLASWDLLSPSPSPPQEPKTSEGIAEAAKMAGWGDLADDMEALLNEDVEDFYA